MVLSTAAVVFIACHGGPADHFATFAQELPKSLHIEVYAAGPALITLTNRQITVKSFVLENEDIAAQDIAQKILTTMQSYPNLVVITDVGHSFAIKMNQALEKHNIIHIPYYDNPEEYVPGAYSQTAAEAMLTAKAILFANAKLAKAEIFQEPGKAINLEGRTRIGLGYYPTEKAEVIARRRETEQSTLRTQLLPSQDLTGKKIAVYFGGNNDVYFQKAFPAFLNLLSASAASADLSHLVIVVQQHPGAKKQKIEDKLVAKWAEENSKNFLAPTIIMSTFGSDEAQVIADGALYYQTSMNLQFALAGINPIFQVAHETFEDSLIKLGFPSITTSEQLKDLIRSWDILQRQGSNKQKVLDALGNNPNWLETLEQLIRQSQP